MNERLFPCCETSQAAPARCSASALGIGANTVIFSAVYAVLLNPLPFKDSDRLVFIEKKNPSRGWVRNPISPAEILAWRNQSGALEDIGAYTQRTGVLTGAVEAEGRPL
jgi:putative ABC transport system permease protein